MKLKITIEAEFDFDGKNNWLDDLKWAIEKIDQAQDTLRESGSAKISNLQFITEKKKAK